MSTEVARLLQKRGESIINCLQTTHPTDRYFCPPCPFTESWQSQTFQRMSFIPVDTTFENLKQMCFSISSNTGYLMQRSEIQAFMDVLLRLLPQTWFYNTTLAMQTLPCEQQLPEPHHFSWQISYQVATTEQTRLQSDNHRVEIHLSSVSSCPFPASVFGSEQILLSLSKPGFLTCKI